MGGVVRGEKKHHRLQEYLSRSDRRPAEMQNVCHLEPILQILKLNMNTRILYTMPIPLRVYREHTLPYTVPEISTFQGIERPRLPFVLSIIRTVLRRKGTYLTRVSRLDRLLLLEQILLIAYEQRNQQNLNKTPKKRVVQQTLNKSE